MNEPAVYIDRVPTARVVKFLIHRRDQVATTAEICDELWCSPQAARIALDRLRKVGRVDEISPNMWHLE
jgi:hypothetical protein